MINGAAREKYDDVSQRADVLVAVRVTVTDLDGNNAPSKSYRLRVSVQQGQWPDDVALAGVGAFFYWNRVVIQGEHATRADFVPLAKQQIPKVFGHDYQTVERSVDNIYPLLMPTYRQEFKERAAKDIIPQA